MVLALYQSSKWKVSRFGALSIYLGQTSGDFQICRQNLGRLENCKIADRLGFSRHLKTRLNQRLKRGSCSCLRYAAIWFSKINTFLTLLGTS